MSLEKEYKSVLKDNAILIRRSKHLIYRLRNGKTFVASHTIGNNREAIKNEYAQLKRLLKPSVNY